MLSIGAKKYIEDNVKEQHQELNKQSNSQILLKNKILNFDRLLEIYSNKSEYKEQILQIVEEIENVTRDGKMLSFYKVAKVDLIINIVMEILNGKEKTYNKKDALKELSLINEDRLFENENIIDDYDNYLKNIKKENLIPYAKALYICEKQKDFDKIENNKIPVYTYWEYVSCLFLTYLDIAYKARNIIIEKYIDEKIHINDYLKNIIDNYESKVNFKYIPSSVLKIDGDEIDSEDEITPFIEINENKKIKRFKLIGYAGVGKTTTLEYIEYQDAINYDKNGKIPVVINLITVNKNEEIEDIIARKLLIDNNGNNKEIIDYIIEKNKINLYLDGVNEIRISDFFERKEFLNRLEEFLNQEKNKNLKVIVTDRDNSEVSILNTSDTFLIQGMTEEDIDKFIDGNTSKENVEKVKSIINENEEFSEIVMQPIMLKDLITIIECNEQIPENIEELSEVYLNLIIKREYEEKKDINANYIDNVLTYMVKKVSDNEKDWTSNLPTSYFKVVDIFNEYAEKENLDFDSDELLNLIKRMGILKEVEFQKYAFTDENFFHIYYYKAINQ